MTVTDTGHVGDGTSANWVRQADGSLDQAKVTDFLYRAAHNVTVAGKAFTQAYYATPVRHAYFDGCSTGGRMALAAAMHYPDDYHGIISGDPAMDFNLNISRMAVQKTLLTNPAGYIPPSLIEALDARIDRSSAMRCDGAKDKLVQDPSRCAVKPEELQCKAGQSGDCLNADQVAMFKAYVNPLRDSRGRVAYPGWPIAHLVGPQGASFYAFGRTAPDMSTPQAPWGSDERNAPRSWRLGTESLTDWLGYGASATLLGADVDVKKKTAGDESVHAHALDHGCGRGHRPGEVPAVLRQGRQADPLPRRERSLDRVGAHREFLR